MVRGLALIGFGLRGSTPCGINARAGSRVTLSAMPTQGHQPCFHFLELLILPTGWREGASTWLPAESFLITGPRTCSSVPHCGGCPDAHPCHPGLRHCSCDPGALTPGPPIAGTHKYLSTAPRISRGVLWLCLHSSPGHPFTAQWRKGIYTPFSLIES